MGQVTITLNGRTYRLRCGDGEEPRLLALAEHVEGKLEQLVSEFGQVGDERLLVMATLMITDELFDARDAQAQLLSSTGDPTALAEEAVRAAELAAIPAAVVASPGTAGGGGEAGLGGDAPPTRLPHENEPPPEIEDRPGEPALRRAIRRNEARASMQDRMAEARAAAASPPAGVRGADRRGG